MELLCLEDTDGNIIKLQVPCHSESGLFCHDASLSNQYCDEFVCQPSNKFLANSSLIVVVDSLHATRSISCHELKSTKQKHILRRTKVQNNSPVLKFRGESELLIKKWSAMIETRVRTTATSTVTAGGSLPKSRRTASELIDQYTSALQCPHDLPEDTEVFNPYTIEAVPVKYEETELSLQPPSDNTKIDTCSDFHRKINTQHKSAGPEITNALTKDRGTDAGSETRTFASPEVIRPDINDTMSRKTENVTTSPTAAASQNVRSKDTKGDTFGPNPNNEMKSIVFGSEITKEIPKKIDVSTAVRKPTDEELQDIIGLKIFNLDGTNKPPESHESVAFIYPCCANKQKSSGKKHIESTDDAFDKDSIKYEDKSIETDMDAGSDTGEPTTNENNTNTNPEINHELLKRYQNVSFPESSAGSSISCLICGKSIELEVDAPACTQQSMSSSNQNPILEMDTPGSRPVTPIMYPGQQCASEPRAAMPAPTPEPRPIHKQPTPAKHMPTPYPVPSMPMPSSLPTKSERIPTTSDRCPKMEMGTPDSRPVTPKIYQQYASTSSVTSPVEKVTPVNSLPESGNPRIDGCKLQSTGTGSDRSWGETKRLSVVSMSNKISKAEQKIKGTGSNERRCYVAKTVDENEPAETKAGPKNIETRHDDHSPCCCSNCAKQHEMLIKGTEPDLSKTRAIATPDTSPVDSPAGECAVLGSDTPHTAVKPKPESEKPISSGIKLQNRGTGSSKLWRATSKPKEYKAPKSKEISEVELNGPCRSCEQPTKTKAHKFNTLLDPTACWSFFKRRRSEKNRMDTGASTVTVDNEQTKPEHNDQTCCAKPCCLNNVRQKINNLSKPCGTKSENHPQSASNVRQVKNDVTTEQSCPNNSLRSAEVVPSKTSSAKSCSSKDAQKNNQITTRCPSSEKQIKSQTEIISKSAKKNKISSWFRSKTSHSSNAIATQTCRNDNCQALTSSLHQITTGSAKSNCGKDAQKKNNQTTARCPSNEIHTKTKPEFKCKKTEQEILNSTCSCIEKEQANPSQSSSNVRKVKNDVTTEPSNGACSVVSVPSNTSFAKSHSSNDALKTCSAKSRYSKDAQKNNQTTARYPSNEIHTKSKPEFKCKKTEQEILNSTCSCSEKRQANPSQSSSNVRKVKNDVTTEPSNGACSVVSVPSNTSFAKSHSSNDALKTCSAKSPYSKDAQKNNQTMTRCPRSEIHTKSQTEIISKKVDQEIINSTSSSCEKEQANPSQSCSNVRKVKYGVTSEPSYPSNCAGSVVSVPSKTSSLTSCSSKDAQKNNQTTTRYPSSERQTKSQIELTCNKCGHKNIISTLCRCTKGQAHHPQSPSHDTHVKNDLTTKPSYPSNCACLAESVPSKPSSAKSRPCKDSSAKSGSCKDSSAESRPCKDSSAESRPCKDSSAESRPCKDSSAESRPCKDSSAKSGSCKDSSAESRPCKDSSAKSGSRKDSSAESRSCKDSSAKSGSCKDSSAESRSCKDSSAESRSCKDSSAKSRPCKDSSAESGSSKDALKSSCAKPSSIKDAQKNNQTTTCCPCSETQTKSQTKIICKCEKENRNSSWFTSEKSHCSNAIAKDTCSNDNRQTSTSSQCPTNEPCYCPKNPTPVSHSVGTGIRVSSSQGSLNSNSGICSGASEVSPRKRQDVSSAKLEDATVQTDLSRTCGPPQPAPPSPPPCRSKLARSFKRIQELTSGGSCACPGKAGDHDVKKTRTRTRRWTASRSYGAVKSKICRCPGATSTVQSKHRNGLATCSQQTEIKTNKNENMKKKQPVKPKRGYKRDTKGVISWEQYEINKKKKKKCKYVSTDVSVPIQSSHKDCCKCTHDFICQCKQSSKHITCECRQSSKHITCECKEFTEDICECLSKGFKVEVKARHGNGPPPPRCCNSNRWI